jgi:hypothetical protein
MTIRKSFLFWMVLLCIFPSGLHATTAFDYSAWDAFLKKNVNENGDVDYQSIKKDPKELNDFLTVLAAVNEREVALWPR